MRVLRRREDRGESPTFTIVTGLSGAGRSEAAHALEDIGYFVVDNLPPALIGKMVDLWQSGEERRRIALVIDVRGGSYFEQLSEALRDLSRRGIEYRILYLTAADDVLVRRYEANKRKHPLADRVIDGIAHEREILAGLLEAADLVIDTSEITVHDLRSRVVSAFSSQSREQRMATTVVSFGFKHGLPLDADMVLDCRFLPNPHWVEDLRPMTGTDLPVRNYVLGQPQTTDFLARLESLFDALVPGFLEEGKRYLTVAIGCTGGRHRSVVIAGEIAAMLEARGLTVAVRHRDMDRT